MIRELFALEGGHCRQLLALVDRRSPRLVRFEAVFLALHHAREGWILVDTGYGEAFAPASARFPQRLYRWATPVSGTRSTASLLRARGIDPAAIRHVILTHFHADHIGGLAEFPQARIHHHAEALAPLQALRPLAQVRNAFLSSLVPSWLPDRAHAIPPTAFSRDAELPFPSHDLFGDGSLRLLELPGHAPGQVGLAFHSPAGPELYAADAYWRESQLRLRRAPLPPALWFQWDRAAYLRTCSRLADLYSSSHYHLSACHDAGTAARLNARGRPS